jgi:serine/threonine protein kinase
MSLTPGTRIGVYEVIEKIGTGGMGEVYRAHDPRLRRDEDVKVLPADVAADPDRLRRFEQGRYSVIVRSPRSELSVATPTGLQQAARKCSPVRISHDLIVCKRINATVT